MVSVRGFADLLLEDCGPQLNDEARMYLERIDANVVRMHRLLEDLLALSRVGRTDTGSSWVDLNEIVTLLLDHLQPRLAARNATVTVSGQLPVVWANATRVEEALSNLIINGITYTPVGRAPRITVRGEDTPIGWSISVWDNGIGIPPEDRANVLHLFRRLPEGKALNPDGTGAGLAIVGRIAEVHGGSITIDDAPGGGTTVTLDLPRP
jgi:signal transduction histidine kinase